MIFKITPVKDEPLERIYEESMKDLRDFYGINRIENVPSILLKASKRKIGWPVGQMEMLYTF